MLTSLELFGFKSFADRTKFDFSPGITAVVGPNGSGKSNVVDGIKWILGDQSPKSLRGKEMTDVIFNGAAGRKASQLAEATLTFDNTSGFLPIDAPEVQIGRRLWRSGDSEYLINRVPARLKDIRDLLMGTGAGSAAYNIIEQGRVDQILQGNAASRRTIFEEAAGISKYKARKVEAQRRIERVDQNLTRLRDIVEELHTRLTTLRTQAAKAAQYREVSEQLRTLWLGMAADDHRHLTRQIEQLDEQIQNCAAELDGGSGRQQELEERLAGFDAEIAVIDDRLRDVEKRRTAQRETIAGHEATIRHQTARRRELEADMVRLRRQRTLMAARARETVGERDHLRQHLAAVEAEFTRRLAEREHHTAERHTLHEAVASARAAVERHRQQLMDQLRRVSAAESRVATLHHQIATAAAAAETVRSRRAALESQLAACRARCDDDRRELHAATARLAAAQEALRRAQADHQALDEAERRTQHTLSDLRQRRSAEQARLTVLEEIDRRQQGLGIGVKEILERAATLDYPPWNRIRGVVADLLQTDLDRAPLLEAALGDRAQLLVIDEFDSLVEYVTSESCRITGRIGFVAHAPDDAAATIPDLFDQPGVVMRADALVEMRNASSAECGVRNAEWKGTESSSSIPHSALRTPHSEHSALRIPHLASRLLADTWIVESLDVAFTLAAGPGRACRFVTLQGERLDADGTLTVGTPRSEAAVVTRKGELRGSRNELLRLDHRIGEEQRRLQELAELLARCGAEIETARGAVQEANDIAAQHQSRYTASEQELARAQRDDEALDTELTRLAAEAQQAQAGSESAWQAQQAAEQELQALQGALADAERAAADGEQRLRTLEQQDNAEQLDLAKHEERVTALRTACERLEHDHQQRGIQQDEAHRRCEAAAAKLQEITLHILNTSAAVAELVLTGEQWSREIETLLAERTLLRTRRGELVQEETRLRQRRRELTDHQHQYEIRARDLRHQWETLAARIQEEYQMTLPEIAASGASALALYRDEHQSRAGEGNSLDTTSKPTGRGPWASSEAWNDEDTTLYAEIRSELEDRVNRLRRKLKTMGAVDTDSLHDLDQLEHRYALHSAQLQDLTEARSALEEIVRRINAESKRRFLETFEEVRGHFQHLFRKAFGGGDGDLVLEDPDDVLECGIEIVARPPGKELKSLSLLSGGEKALTAFALLLALFKSRPSPYCLLDEVDAPLDEANVGRLGALLEEFKGTTQFIVITHKKPTMTIADVLYGVTMEESGVSKRMSVRFEDISDTGEFAPRGESSPAQRAA